MHDDSNNPSRNRPAHRRWLLALGGLALVLYLPASWWGVPYATNPDRTHGWGVDDITPLGALAEIHDMLKHRPNPNLGYPMLHPFLALAAYTPYLGWLRCTGQWTTITGEYPYGFADPLTVLKTLGWIAHLLSVVMGAGVVVSAADGAATLWGKKAGIVAGLLMLVSYPMFYYSRTGNVDVPMLFFIALTLAAFARMLAHGVTNRRAVWLGVFVGCGLATKEQAFASFLALPLVLVPLHVYQSRTGNSWFSRRFWVAPAAALLAAFLAYGLGSGMFISPDRYFAHLDYISQRVGEAATGQVAFVKHFPRTPEGHLRLAMQTGQHLAESMTWLGLALAALGIRSAWRKSPLSVAFILPAVTYLLVLFLSVRMVQLRYVMPAALTLLCFTAAALAAGLESSRRGIRAISIAAASLILGVGLLRGLDLTYSMLHDSRYAAGEWLAEYARPGDRVEYFGASQTLPPIPAGVLTARAGHYKGAVNRPDAGARAAAGVRSDWARRKPDFVVIVPDHSSASGAPHSAWCPPRVFDDLKSGKLGLHLAATFQTQSLVPWLPRPALDYPTVNPPIQVFARQDRERAQSAASRRQLHDEWPHHE